MIEKINNSFWRSNTKFGRMKKEKRSNKIKEIWEVKLMLKSNFSKQLVRAKYVAITCNRNKILVSESIFKVVCLCESCRGSEMFCCS